ncbi:hypothetical protein L1987_08826 [Smallanthus sonchifolius]|uniref:Uncharacterized protein n=1 Tax=Smallanthus sonchifolius TaxID=185202 RepID=A0ACB9JPD5_9ASTR|nr:hypothetical protein L1987_08826 [Smallanthus sonchifolius]
MWMTTVEVVLSGCGCSKVRRRVNVVGVVVTGGEGDRTIEMMGLLPGKESLLDSGEHEQPANVYVPSPPHQQQQDDDDIPDVVIHFGEASDDSSTEFDFVLKALNKGKYVPLDPTSTSHPDSSSTQSDAHDKKIQELEEKVEKLEAQVVGLQGQIDVLQHDDFQLRTCQGNSKYLAARQTIIDKQQKEILLNKRQIAEIQTLAQGESMSSQQEAPVTEKADDKGKATETSEAIDDSICQDSDSDQADTIEALIDLDDIDMIDDDDNDDLGDDVSLEIEVEKNTHVSFEGFQDQFNQEQEPGVSKPTTPVTVPDSTSEPTVQDETPSLYKNIGMTKE